MDDDGFDRRDPLEQPERSFMSRIPADVLPLVQEAIEKAEVFGLSVKFTERQLELCESPIEFQLLSQMMLYANPGIAGVMDIYCQVWVYDVDVSSKKVDVRRVDFLIGLNWEFVSTIAFSGGEYIRELFKKPTWGERFLPFFGVECDGRDTHTSFEAISNDKKRDRRLSTLGLPIIRFTGTEIFQEGPKCAQEIVTLFGQHLRQSFLQGITIDDVLSLSTDRIVPFRGLGLSMGYDRQFKQKLEDSLIPPF